MVCDIIHFLFQYKGCHMTTTSINTADAKEDFSELVNRVSHNKERILLTRRGKAVAAIIPIEDLASIEDAQSKQELEEAMEALKEARSHGTVTLEELKENIG
jgi:prevent-host-death family protein